MKIKTIAADIDFLLKNIYDIISLKYEKRAAEILTEKNLTISTAESCTGGLISSRLTDLSGSSAYIHKNFVTYANTAKEELLGVKSTTIDTYGVVSAETAKEMAAGLIEKYGCDIALSVTGIAGPLGGSEKKPVGLVFIGIASKSTVETYKFQANSSLSRRFMKYAFACEALKYLADFLKKTC